MKTTTKIKRKMRHKRVRAKIKGTAQRPRLSVFKSNYHLYAQIINDNEGKTFAAASDKEIKLKTPEKLRNGAGKTKKALAYEIGKLAAKKAAEIGISSVIFDRGGYKFHGIIS
ncbi:MAG: 50S ribosomal protein L18, partial [bacterium]|nr:50S ribosomal protein L18 [bacterium]